MVRDISIDLWLGPAKPHTLWCSAYLMAIRALMTCYKNENATVIAISVI